MSVMTYHKEVIFRQIQSLSETQRLAFAASCCERLLGNYSAFKNETGWGDEKPLRTTLDRIWRLAGGEIASTEEISELSGDCEAVAPDSDDFESLMTASAQDAVLAICSICDYLANGDVVRLVQCALYCIDTVDLFVQEIENMPANSPDLEERIREHPLMQREIKRQYDDLSELTQTHDIREIEQRSRSATASNLGL